MFCHIMNDLKNSAHIVLATYPFLKGVFSGELIQNVATSRYIPKDEDKTNLKRCQLLYISPTMIYTLTTTANKGVTELVSVTL